jgi:transcriptional regulator with GAF, ATPase, and Fis domain
MVTDLDDEGQNLNGLHSALLTTESVEQFLHEMSVLAADLIGGDISCGMTMQPSGRPVTVACSDPVAARVDGLQYELDDGPCLHAMRAGHVVQIENTSDKAQWPEFETQAESAGIRSCLALPLSADGQPVGAINLYARKAAAFGTAAARRAENFAENASGALILATRLAADAALIEQLRSSLASRTIIDQALGIIMAREHCTQSHAFAILRSASQNGNVKLRDIATAVVTSVTGQPPEPPPPFADVLATSHRWPRNPFALGYALPPPSESALAVALSAGDWAGRMA